MASSDDVLKRLADLSRQLDAAKASANEMARMVEARREGAARRNSAPPIGAAVSDCRPRKRRRTPKPR